MMAYAAVEWQSMPGASISSVHARTPNNSEEGSAMQMATQTRRWTLEEVHSLPDDGNKYELIHGELFVTPPPTDPHETIAARLTRLLDPYVVEQKLGFVYRPRAVLRFEDSELEPDLMVRQPNERAGAKWEEAPIPTLIVEIGSPSTWRRDRTHKRHLYIEAGVEEYWIVDPDQRAITSIREGRADVVMTEPLHWRPNGSTRAFEATVTEVFG
jgi:Uma2 family endonuclease